MSASSSPNGTSSTSSTVSACSDCGTAVMSLTDAAGDFVSYIVNVVSLKLTNANGAVVETIPATTQVDFAQLVNLSEIISADSIPSGQYVSVSLTLDYSNATIVVNNGTTGVTIAPGNIINGATSLPLAAPNPTQVTLTLSLDANNQFVITPGVVANLALDFNLAASNTIAPSDTDPTTVTVNPVLTASLVPDVTKQIRVRGGFVSADTTSFIINVHPFYTGSGAYGQLTVNVTSSTTYAINGTNYTGSAGLTELATLSAGTMIVAYGSWDRSTQTFTAASVLAGTSVPAIGRDHLNGIVTARSGDTLTVTDGLIQRMNFWSIDFSRQTSVTVGTGTTVTELGQSGSFTIADISVGQQIQASGTFSGSGSGTFSFDATQGSVVLVPTVVQGSVTATGVNSVTLDLMDIDGFAASMFNFAGTGKTAAQDATTSAYSVALPSVLSPSPLLATKVAAEFTGFVAPFGDAPPDFSATTLVSLANMAAFLEVRWSSGYAAPFSTLSSTDITVSQAALEAASRHVIRIGFETIDPSTLTGGLELMPNASAPNQFFAIGHQMSWKADNFTTFGDFEAALAADLTGTTQVLQLTARGPYAAGVMSVNDVEVLLSD